MPAVLTEVGFISNAEEEQYMMSDEGQATIVVCLFKALAKYKSTV
jgi:N-acetylmuramoyl-L-alanine amidase